MTARFSGVLLLACACFAGMAVSQTTTRPSPKPTPAGRDGITLARVQETIGFLASDDLAGRDTPSRGLEIAARHLERRLQVAGLEGIVEGGHVLPYERPGVLIDSRGLAVTLRTADGGTLPLRAGDDVRLLRGPSSFAVENVEMARLQLEKARSRSFWPGRRSERPVFLEVAPDSVFWKMTAGPRTELASRRALGAPVLLVRPGAIGEGFTHADVEVNGVSEVTVPLANIGGMLRGSERPDEIILVTAHYDHVGIRLPSQGDAIYNGADDNATGTTAVMLLAEALAGRSLPRSVAFVFFSGEEKGLLGSKAFAKNPPWPLDRVVAQVNIEMIGRPQEGKAGVAWVTGRDLSDFEDALRLPLKWAGIDLVDFPMAGRLFAASDNYPLAQKGVVAHSISAGSLHDDYHRPTDEVERLDLTHMTEVIRGLHDAVVALAKSDRRLAYNAKGRRRLRLDAPAARKTGAEPKRKGGKGQ